MDLMNAEHGHVHSTQQLTLTFPWTNFDFVISPFWRFHDSIQTSDIALNVRPYNQMTCDSSQEKDNNDDDQNTLYSLMGGRGVTNKTKQRINRIISTSFSGPLPPSPFRRLESTTAASATLECAHGSISARSHSSRFIAPLPPPEFVSTGQKHKLS